MAKKIKTSLALLLNEQFNNLIVEKGITMKHRINFRKTQNSIKADLESYHESRDSLVKELGTEEKGSNGQFTFEGESKKEFTKQIEEALDQEIEISLYFDITSLEDINPESDKFYGNVIDLVLT
jgi:hypothetical protein